MGTLSCREKKETCIVPICTGLGAQQAPKDSFMSLQHLRWCHQGWSLWEAIRSWEWNLQKTVQCSYKGGPTEVRSPFSPVRTQWGVYNLEERTHSDMLAPWSGTSSLHNYEKSISVAHKLLHLVFCYSGLKGQRQWYDGHRAFLDLLGHFILLVHLYSMNDILL